MGGKLTFPGASAYHASKYAIEAFSDALRFEVAGFGIQVVLIEPGIIRTEFSATAAGELADDIARRRAVRRLRRVRRGGDGERLRAWRCSRAWAASPTESPA